MIDERQPTRQLSECGFPKPTINNHGISNTSLPLLRFPTFFPSKPTEIKATHRTKNIRRTGKRLTLQKPEKLYTPGLARPPDLTTLPTRTTDFGPKILMSLNTQPHRPIAVASQGPVFLAPARVSEIQWFGDVLGAKHVAEDFLL